MVICSAAFFAATASYSYGIEFIQIEFLGRRGFSTAAACSLCHLISGYRHIEWNGHHILRFHPMRAQLPATFLCKSLRPPNLTRTAYSALNFHGLPLRNQDPVFDLAAIFERWRTCHIRSADHSRLPAVQGGHSYPENRPQSPSTVYPVPASLS